MNQLRGSRKSADIARYDALNSRFFNVLQQKESYWKQRAKQLWLQGGDNNTKFFHAWANKRHRQNNIVALQNS